MTKTCTKCGEVKPLDGFHRDSKKQDGRFSHCKECVSAQHRARREARKRDPAAKINVTVMKRCVYNACTSKQCDETQLGFCAYHDGQARKYLASHRQYAGRSGCTPRITDLRKK